MPTGDDYRKDPDAVARLDPLQHAVTQQDATEPAFGNRFSDHDEPGIDVDVVSGEPLLTSVDTFSSSLGASRIEVRSGHADSHLGHVFADGPAERGGLRCCINSAALRFVAADDLDDEGYGRYSHLFEEEES